MWHYSAGLPATIVTLPAFPRALTQTAADVDGEGVAGVALGVVAGAARTLAAVRVLLVIALAAVVCLGEAGQGFDAPVTAKP
jgi:hypothetical protein